MKVIVGVISRSIQSFVYIALLLFLFVFIYALLGRQIYAGELSFDDNPVRQNFDTGKKKSKINKKISKIIINCQK
jgi:hypothetical protein